MCPIQPRKKNHRTPDRRKKPSAARTRPWMSWPSPGMKKLTSAAITFPVEPWLMSESYGAATTRVARKGLPERPLDLVISRPGGSEDERSPRTRRHEKGRVRPDLGWKARKVGRRRPPFRGLGDLPPQGIAR